jgi:hypothetical protein
MSATHSTQWFWSDWAGDFAVRTLTPAERGLWIDLLTLAAFGNPTGYVCDARGTALPLEQIARFANCSSTAECGSLIDGILAKGCASKDRDGRLFNRRMVRDVALSVKRRRAGQVGGAVTARKWQPNSGLPGQLPGHVPRQMRTRPSKKEIKTTTFPGTAREGLAVAEPSAELSNTTDTGGLAEIIRRKGWVP